MGRFQTRRPHQTDPAFWLRNCTGYSVYSEDGRIGVVDEVVEVDGEPARLRVRSGLFHSSARTLDALDVVDVEPREMRVIMRVPAADGNT
jgi:hypothetical protein